MPMPPRPISRIRRKSPRLPSTLWPWTLSSTTVSASRAIWISGSRSGFSSMTRARSRAWPAFRRSEQSASTCASFSSRGPWGAESRPLVSLTILIFLPFQAARRKVEALRGTESGPQLHERPQEQHGGGRRRPFHASRHLLDGEALHAREVDHPRVVGPESGQRLLQPLESFVLTERPARGGRPVFEEHPQTPRAFSFRSDDLVQRLWVPLDPAGLVLNDVGGDGVQPGPERRLVLPPELPDGLEGPQKGFLHQVLQLHRLTHLLSGLGVDGGL